MKNGWEVKELAAVSAINYGFTESASSEPVGPRFLRITDIQDDHVDWDRVPYCKIEPGDVAKYRLASGDIVFARTGATTGKSFLVNEPPNAVFASYLIRLRLLNKNLLPEFVSLFFQTEGYWQSIKDGSSGSAQGGFNATKLGALSIPIPPLAKQQRIVGILDQAFDGIATAKANAEKNLLNARALFESHLQSVFTQRGNGWVETKLDDVCEQITDGKHGDCNDEVGSGFYFLSAKDVKAGTLNYERARQITRVDFEETHRRTNLEPGDILITNSGTIGRMAIALADDKTTRTTFQKSVAILKPVKVAIDSKFAFYCLSSGLTRFVNLSAGAAQKNLLLRDLRGYRFALPRSLGEQRAVATQLDNLFAVAQCLESLYHSKLAALSALKKSLLHQAFSGGL